jgi:predicted dehydrogenase
MAELPAYVILGRGRWAQRMRDLLPREGRRVSIIEETRRHSEESESDYVARLKDGMRKSEAAIAWLCVLPGPHVAQMILAGIEAGLDLIVEKPWWGSQEETGRLQRLALAKSRLIAIDYEYLLHAEVENWRKRFYPGENLKFGARFFLSRPNRNGMSPMDNLGTHLLSIREYAAPASTVSEVACAYEQPDERLVWIERDGEQIASIDLLKGSEQLIQDFFKNVEAAQGRAAFPIDLDFAWRVSQQLRAHARGTSL